MTYNNVYQSYLHQFIAVGPRPPDKVQNITVIHITSHEATIQWRVPFLRYTPEIYTIYYQNTTQNLTSTERRSSGMNFTLDLNLILNVRLVSLAPGANYTYFITATNSIGSNSSEKMSFATKDFSMLTGHSYNAIIS